MNAMSRAGHISGQCATGKGVKQLFSYVVGLMSVFKSPQDPGPLVQLNKFIQVPIVKLTARRDFRLPTAPEPLNHATLAPFGNLSTPMAKAGNVSFGPLYGMMLSMASLEKESQVATAPQKGLAPVLRRQASVACEARGISVGEPMVGQQIIWNTFKAKDRAAVMRELMDRYFAPATFSQSMARQWALSPERIPKRLLRQKDNRALALAPIFNQRFGSIFNVKNVGKDIEVGLRWGLDLLNVSFEERGQGVVAERRAMCMPACSKDSYHYVLLA